MPGGVLAASWACSGCASNVPVPRKCPLLSSHSWARPSIRGPWQSSPIAGDPRLLLVAWLSRSQYTFATMCMPRVRTSRQILLVGKHQQQSILHFPVLNNPCEFGPRLLDAVAIVRVDNEDEALSPCALLVNLCASRVQGDRVGRVVCSASCARACSPTRNRVVATQHTREVVSP
jgi:hypothetical protein